MANDVHELTIAGTAAGQYVENILHFTNSNTNSATPETDAESLLSEWAAAGQPVWLDCLPNDYIQHGFRARRVNNTGGNSATNLTPGAQGSNPNSSMSSGCGPLITSSYNNTGGSPARWRATRIFMPTFPGLLIVGNEIQPALQADLSALIDVLQSTLSGSAFQWLYCAWSRKQKVSYQVSNFNVSTLIGTQRKRLRPSL